jgi:Repeat of unknown function (DUF5648)
VNLAIRISFLLFLCIFPAAHAAAFITDCALTGVGGFSPFHPRATDQIEFTVGLYAINTTDSSGTPRMVLSRATLGGNNQIALDIVVTTDKGPFPGYDADVVSYGPPSTIGYAWRASGSLGALPVGEYTVTSTIHVYDARTGLSPNPCLNEGMAIPLTVYSTSGIAPVVEFYNSGLDRYFLTQDTNEIQDLDIGVHPGWLRTGQSFFAYIPGQSGGHVPPAYRFYGLPSARLDAHVFTMGASAETFNLMVGALSRSWKLETYDAFELYYPDRDGSCRTGTVPVYRLWNQRVDSNHRYTTDPAIKAEMIARGYVAEGYGNDAAFFCALASDQ